MEIRRLPAFRVRAGRGSAAASVSMRLRAAPRQLLLPTVAHVLFGSDGRLRGPVRVGSAEATVFAAVPLPSRGPFIADAALLAVPDVDFIPAAGHLEHYCPALRVIRVGPSGKIVRGVLVESRWRGPLAYHFGMRHLVDQWIVEIEPSHGNGITHAGDSGAVWMTAAGVAVGLQVGVLRSSRRRVVVTPMATLCRLFEAAVAA